MNAKNKLPKGLQLFFTTNFQKKKNCLSKQKSQADASMSEEESERERVH